MSLANLSAAQQAFISSQYGDEFLAMPESELIDLLDADYNYLISDESPESAESLEQINMLGSIMSTLMQQGQPMQVAASAAHARAKIRLRAKMAVVRRAAREAITKRVAAANPKDVRTATAKARKRAVELVAAPRKASILERLAARREELVDEQLGALHERLGARIAQREASVTPQFIKVAGQLFEKVEDLASTVVVGAVKSNEELVAEASTEAPKFIKIAGKLFEKVDAQVKTAAPVLPPEYNIPVTAADLDPEVVSWFHSSQGDPIYALGSRLVAYGETLASQDELSALEYTLGKWLADPANASVDPNELDRIEEVRQAAQALMPIDSAEMPGETPNFIKVNGQVYELDAVRTAEIKAKEAPKFIKVAGKLFERED